MELTFQQSLHIHKISYNEPILKIYFKNNTIKKYTSVPPVIIKRLSLMAAADKWYNKHINHHYPSSQVDS